MDYSKDFDGWIRVKSDMDQGQTWPQWVYPGEVWWCSLGVNVGAEIDGKGASFERPVLVLLHFNKSTVLAAPITSTLSHEDSDLRLTIDGIASTVKLNQIRTVSKKRLSKMATKLSPSDFKRIYGRLRKLIS